MKRKAEFFRLGVSCLFGVITLHSFGLTITQKKNEEKPNILWLVCEDISPYLSFYGDSTANTPNLDQLANESLVFTNCFSTSGVCAPSRATLITGMYPTSIGTQHMRTANDAMGWGRRVYREANSKSSIDLANCTIREYSAVLPAYVKCFTEYLRAEGYFCTNNFKTDYNFAAPLTAWDENNYKASWEDCPEGKPFFSVFSYLVTHESQIWGRASYPQTVNPANVPLPPYFPDDSVVRNDVARNYSNIEALDGQIGDVINALKKEGLYEKTIIFFFSDNGGPLPRGKRETLETGLHVPFMVRFPGGINKGRTDDLVSFVDFAPTVLSLAGIAKPNYMQGQAFSGDYKSHKQREYAFGAGDRFDEYTDRIRAVRDGRFLYIRNYYPELPYYKDISFRKSMPLMKRLLVLRDAGKLSEPESRWFLPLKLNKEELYDCVFDPANMNNLIENPAYSDKANELRDALDKWISSVGDKGAIPESIMIRQMWPGNVQPVAEKPTVTIRDGRIQIICKTEGSSIAYLLSDKKVAPGLDSGWQLYSKPLEAVGAKFLYCIGTRIGFADSDMVEIEVSSETHLK